MAFRPLLSGHDDGSGVAVYGTPELGRRGTESL